MIFVIGAFALLLLQCNRNEGEIVEKHFSTSDYFNQQTEKLIHKPVILIKTAFLNEKSGIDTINSENWGKKEWQKEFSVFKSADINKPALLGQYDIETIEENGVVTEIYSARSQKARTRKLTVEMSDGIVTQLEMTIKDENFIYKSDQLLMYFPDSLYIIKSKQDVLLDSENRMEVVVKIISQE